MTCRKLRIAQASSYVGIRWLGRRLAASGADWACACLLALAGAAGPAMAQGGPGGLAEIDSNADGAITRAEAEAARARLFSRLDQNRDGYLDELERTTRAGARLRADADADGDNRLSRDEFMGQPYRVFERLDANADGVLSAAEIEAARPRQNAPEPP